MADDRRTAGCAIKSERHQPPNTHGRLVESKITGHPVCYVGELFLSQLICV